MSTNVQAASPRIDADVANQTVVRALSEWEGITLHRHVMGGIEFRYGTRNLGHLHDPPGKIATADLVYPKHLRDELVASGRARRHVTDRPGITGWFTVPMRTEADVDYVIDLFRQSYERIRRAGSQHSR